MFHKVQLICCKDFFHRIFVNGKHNKFLIFIHNHNNAEGMILIIVKYRKTSNISRTLVCNKIVDNSDVVGASPVGAAPTTSSFST